MGEDTDQILVERQLATGVWFKEIVETLPLGVSLLAPDGTYLYVNGTFTQMFGYSLRDIPHGRNWLRLAFPDPANRRHVVETWLTDRRRYGLGETRPRTFQVTCRDGSSKWILIRPVEFETGEEFVTYEDVTEYVRAEARQKAHQNSLRAVLRLSQMRDESIADIVTFVLNQAAELTGSTRAILKLLQTSTVPPIYQWSRENPSRVTPADMESALRSMPAWNSEQIAAGQPVMVNDPATDRDKYLLLPFREADQVVLIGAVSGKTEDYEEADQDHLTLLLSGLWRLVQRKKAAEALAQSEERYRSVVENTPYGLFIAAIDTGRFVILNRVALEMFGYSLTQALEMSLWDWVHPQDHTVLRSNMPALETTRPRGPEPQVYTGLGRDGTPMRFELTLSRIHFRDQPAIQGLIRDVTEWERLEKQLQHAQKMEAVATLANGVAHEFNNILMAIRGYTQLIGAGMSGNERMERHLARINENVDRAADLTTKMLAFSRLEPGEKAPLDINQIVTTVGDLLRQTMPASIEVTLALTPNLPVTLASRTQLEQVLLNLTLNAKDALSKGGRITITTQIRHLDGAFCQDHPWATPGRYVEVSVADDGPGIPADVLQRVFEPFFTTKGPGRGTGLGLAVAYSIVKNHHGYILGESTPGKDTIFRVYLPTGGTVESTIRGPLTQSNQRESRNMSILVVDDEQPVRIVYQTALEAGGYQTRGATNGGEALRLYRQAMEDGRPFDLVLMDFLMPVMDGAQCAERLLELDPQARIIVATGHGGTHIRESPVGSRLAGLMTKPFELKDLLVEVRRVLET